MLSSSSLVDFLANVKYFDVYEVSAVWNNFWSLTACVYLTVYGAVHMFVVLVK